MADIEFVGWQGYDAGDAEAPTNVAFALADGLDTVPAEDDIVLILQSTIIAPIYGGTVDPVPTTSGYSRAFPIVPITGNPAYGSTKYHKMGMCLHYKFMGATPDTTWSGQSNGFSNGATGWLILVFRNVNQIEPFLNNVINAYQDTGSYSGLNPPDIDVYDNTIDPGELSTTSFPKSYSGITFALQSADELTSLVLAGGAICSRDEVVTGNFTDVFWQDGLDARTITSVLAFNIPAEIAPEVEPPVEPPAPTVGNPFLRVWGFSLDGHDFYVISLGETSTLVYDLTTGQWSEWFSPEETVWKAHTGTNWVSLGLDTYTTWDATSNVIAGDNNYGVLWMVDPDVGTDEDPVTAVATPFSRQITGGIQQKLRETQAVGAAYLLASAGSPQVTGSSFTLRTSDDAGKTWTNHGTVTAELANYSQEFVWRSLGLIKQPGKLFEITDSGASIRIDSLDIR